MKKISVVIPVYNSIDTIFVCVQSVLNQKYYGSLEVIIVDDCSNNIAYLDQIIEIFAKYKATYIFVRHEINRGVGAARKSGIERATGDYIALLDSDDTWLSNKLQKEIDFLETNKDYLMVGCLTNMPASMLPPFCKKKINGVEIKIQHQIFKNYFQPSGVVIRSEILKNNICWPERRYAEEGEVFSDIISVGKTYLINEILVDYSGGKRGFGITGLSSKIHATEKEEIINIYKAFRRKQINFVLFVTAILFSYTKYIRRIILFTISKCKNDK